MGDHPKSVNTSPQRQIKESTSSKFAEIPRGEQSLSPITIALTKNSKKKGLLPNANKDCTEKGGTKIEKKRTMPLIRSSVKSRGAKKLKVATRQESRTIADELGCPEHFAAASKVQFVDIFPSSESSKRTVSICCHLNPNPPTQVVPSNSAYNEKWPWCHSPGSETQTFDPGQETRTERVTPDNKECFSTGSKVEFVDMLASSEGSNRIVPIYRYINPNPPMQFIPVKSARVLELIGNPKNEIWPECNSAGTKELKFAAGQGTQSTWGILGHKEYFSPGSKVEFVDNFLSGRSKRSVFIHRYLNPKPPTQIFPINSVFALQLLEKRTNGMWPGCHVSDLSELEILENHCIVEVPPVALPGFEYLVKWPSRLAGFKHDIFVFKVPDSFRPGDQYIHIIAPAYSQSAHVPLSRQSQHKMSDLHPSGESPGKEWRHYKKSCSRVGSNYQVSIFPSCANWKDSEAKAEMYPSG